MKRLFLFIFSSFILFATSGNASTEKENRSVSGFNSIKVSSGIDLYLKMGDTEEVIIEADDDFIDRIITEVDNGVLKIYVKDRLTWRWRSSRKAYVTVKELEMLKASAGSDVVGQNTIVSKDLEIDVSSGSDLKLEVKTKSLSLEASSGSDARVSGVAEKFEADASSGSDIYASELKTKYCDVETSSGSDASVNVSEELRARASSGGDIKYYGNPKSTDIHKSSGGGVYKR